MALQQPIQQPYNYPYSFIPNQPVIPNQQVIQNNQSQQNVITVKTKEEAFYWPVGPGNSMIFRKEDGTSIYIKTMGYSTSEPPIFEEFSKVIEEPVQNAPDYKSEIDKLWGEINALKNRQKPQNNKRREDGHD